MATNTIFKKLKNRLKPSLIGIDYESLKEGI